MHSMLSLEVLNLLLFMLKKSSSLTLNWMGKTAWIFRHTEWYYALSDLCYMYNFLSNCYINSSISSLYRSMTTFCFLYFDMYFFDLVWLAGLFAFLP